MTLWYDLRLRLIVEGIIIGLCSGTIVVFYRFLLDHALKITMSIYSYEIKHLWLIPIWTTVLAAGGWLTGVLVKNNSVISGSGIPQVKGVLHHKLRMSWWKTILGKFICGTICIGSGLSLGREGPSIQIGACVGQGFSSIFHKMKLEEHFLITCGASAGLSAAFNAPIAGVIFALEELHGNFSPLVMISALASSLMADFISSEFYGWKPIFVLNQFHTIPLSHYVYLIVLGLLVGILGVTFNSLLFKAQDFYNQKWLPSEARTVFPFLLAGTLGLILPQVLGGGSELVNSFLRSNFSIPLLLTLLAIKLAFTIFSYGSSAPGGIFMPLLVIGALIGALYCKVLQDLIGLNDTYSSSLIILAMAGFFTSIVKTPITGIILLTEMSGSFINLLPTGVVCLASYVTAELLRSRPVYDTLLERFLHQRVSKFEQSCEQKVLLEIAIHPDSALNGKLIRQMKRSSNCLIVGILRGGKEIIPNGDTIIVSGDCLIILTNENDASFIRENLSATIV